MFLGDWHPEKRRKGIGIGFQLNFVFFNKLLAGVLFYIISFIVHQNKFAILEEIGVNDSLNKNILIRRVARINDGSRA